MHTDAKLYYALLGIDPEASDEAIRLAFRRRAKELHPDSASGSASDFIRLKRAYDTLSDPDRRAEYDRACQQRPSVLDMPPPSPRTRPRPQHRRRAPRRSGIGFGRYVIAFVVIGGLSYGAIEAMISWTEAPSAPSIHAVMPRNAGGSANEPSTGPDAEAPPAPSGPGSTRSGIWDPGPATPVPPAGRKAN